MSFRFSFDNLNIIRNESINFILHKAYKLINIIKLKGKIYLTNVDEICDVLRYDKNLIVWTLTGLSLDINYHSLRDTFPSFRKGKYILNDEEIPRFCEYHNLNKKFTIKFNFKNNRVDIYLKLTKKSLSNDFYILENDYKVLKKNYDILSDEHKEVILENGDLVERNKYLSKVIERSINNNIEITSKYENLINEKDNKICFLEEEICSLRNFINPPLPSTPFDTKSFLHSIVSQN